MLRNKFLFVALLIVLITVNSHVFGGNEKIDIQYVDLREKLLYNKNGDLWITDVQKMTQPTYFIKSGDITDYSVSGDCRYFLIIRKSRIIDVIDFAQKKVVSEFETTFDIGTPSLSLSGNEIVYAANSDREFQRTPYVKEKVKHVFSMDLKTKRKRDLTFKSSYANAAPKLSPDGKTIAFASTKTRGKPQIYLMTMLNFDISDAISEGIYSEWIDDRLLMIGSDFNHYQVIDVRTQKIIKKIEIVNAQWPQRFSYFQKSDVLCYEDSIDTPGSNISCMDMNTKIKKVIAEDASNPVICEQHERSHYEKNP